jgi:hypothetical protein
MALKKVEPRQEGNFVSILADGLFHLTATEETEGAVKREYETSDGKKGEKWELVYSELSGKISKVEFRDGNFGRSLQITVLDGEEDPVIISTGASGNFGMDIMKKLPAVNLEEEVKFVPYSFKDDKGKIKRGMTIYQDEEKIPNFYYDEVKKENKFDFPEIDTAKLKKKKKNYWKGYFLEVEEFLVDDITKRLKIEKSDIDKEFENF